MNITIKYQLWEIRTEQQLSSRQLAKLSGVSKTTINDIENHRHSPTIYTLCLLAEALQIPPEKLYSYEIIP